MKLFKHKWLRLLFVIVGLALFSSCSSSVNLTSVKKANYDHKIQNVAIIFNNNESINTYVRFASVVLKDSLESHNVNTNIVLVPDLKKEYPNESDEVIKKKTFDFIREELKEKKVQYLLIYEAKTWVYPTLSIDKPYDIEFELQIVDLKDQSIVWKSKLNVNNNESSANSAKSAKSSVKYIVEDLLIKEII